MNAQNALTIFSNEHLRLSQADFCTVPGYLILRFNTPAESFAELSTAALQAFGELMGVAVAALESVTGADRVYCLSFCEVDRRLHLHLFPRTNDLLQAYQSESGTGGEPANGALLFEWARARYPWPADNDLPDSVAHCCQQLRKKIPG